jgi:hypothetical protein
MRLMGCGAVLLGVLASCAASPESQGDRFEIVGPDQFRFITTASMMQPLNSRQAEHARLVRLQRAVDERKLCASGYSIASRNPPPFRETGTQYEYTVTEITYVGVCKK